MTRLLARLLYAFTSLATRLPWPWLYRLADGATGRMLHRDRRECRVVRCNLDLAFPDLSAAERAQLQQSVMRTTSRQLVETLRLWTRPHGENLALIRERHGTEHLDAAIAAGKGVIIAAPHYGNWELLNQWLAARTPLAILYAPPESKVAEAFLNLVRADDAAPVRREPGAAERRPAAPRVTQVRAEAAGVRQLFKRLSSGGVVGILPDQQPKRGDGEFAPFFGTDALTMTLLGRLAARSGATVLMGYCERLANDPDTGAPGFALRLEPVPAAVADPDPAVAVRALNATIERVVRRDPSQYQWTYKRYSLRPTGGGDDNPYWPQCYRSAGRA